MHVGPTRAEDIKTETIHTNVIKAETIRAGRITSGQFDAWVDEHRAELFDNNA